ncbi:TPA: hypothetical protein ACPSKE_002835 [Legionella feeleii]
MNEENKIYFDKEKQKKAMDWINSKWLMKTCDVCQHNRWEVSDFIIASPRFEGGISLGAGVVAPHIMLTCINCGNTKFFNAVIMGIVEGVQK